jgi:hypothetical protein
MPMGKMTRVEFNADSKLSEEPLRTNEVEGYWMMTPEPGVSFTFCGKPLTEMDGGVRVITTSAVVRVYLIGKDKYFDTTSGSTYKLEEFAKA